MPRRLAAALAFALLLPACASSGAGHTTKQAAPGAPAAAVQTPSTQASPTTTGYPTYKVATATVPQVEIFDGPGQDKPARTIENPNSFYGTPRVFLVREERGDWLNVFLPIRPNESTGWIRRSDVELAQHDFRMTLDLTSRRLTVYQRNDLFLESSVAVGTPSTPTPTGLYYTTELLIPDGQPAYGPYAFGLSGHSEVLFEFGGGDGQFALHGTNDPSSIGNDVSNGCIRLPNDEITKLAEALPIGVPLEIRA